MFYLLDNCIFTTWDDLCDYVIEHHPQLTDDAMVEFLDDNVEEFDTFKEVEEAVMIGEGVWRRASIIQTFKKQDHEALDYL